MASLSPSLTPAAFSPVASNPVASTSVTSRPSGQPNFTTRPAPPANPSVPQAPVAPAPRQIPPNQLYSFPASAPPMSTLPASPGSPKTHRPHPSLTRTQFLKDSYRYPALAAALTVGGLETASHVANYRAGLKAVQGLMGSPASVEWLSNLWQSSTSSSSELAKQFSQSTVNLLTETLPALKLSLRQNLAGQLLQSTLKAGATGVVAGLATFSLTKMLTHYPHNPVTNWFHELWQPSNPPVR